MVEGAADRAGSSLLQAFCQNSCLLIQKRPVFSLVDGPQPFLLFHSCPVDLLRLLKLLPQASVCRKLCAKILKGLFFLAGLFLLTQ